MVKEKNNFNSFSVYVQHISTYISNRPKYKKKNTFLFKQTFFLCALCELTKLLSLMMLLVFHIGIILMYIAEFYSFFSLFIGYKEVYFYGKY